MNNQKRIMISLSAIFLILTSCKKHEVVPTPESPQETFSSLNEYLTSKEPTSENFVFNVQNGTQITTANGSVITIPANAFILPNGQSVTGQVSLKVKEIFSKKDMIFSRMFPVSNGNVLNSGGEFFIQASQNGTVLRVANGAFIEFDMPAQAIDNQMELFFAGPNPEPDTINWNPIDSSSTASGFVFNSADNSYEINLDSTGWGNIDAFNWSVTYFDCQFNLTGVNGLNSSNTTAFAVFTGKNTVWPVGVSNWGSISNNVINETHLADVPLNLVVISVVQGQLYYGLLNITPQQGTTYSVQMQTTTSANLDQIIESLP